jgi:drug/metabolite transporter (DMT)-like permease
MRFTLRFFSWLVLFATLLMWSGNWIVARAARDDIAPGMATAGRLLLVLAILLPFTFQSLRTKLAALSRSDWFLLACLGLTGGGVNMALQWLALHYTTATSGILYLSTTPIFILLFALPLGERVGPLQIAGVAISFCGVATIAAQGDPSRLSSLSFNIGDLMALGSMVMFAGYTVLLRVRRFGLDIVELLVMVCGLGLLFMLPWLAWELAAGVRLRISANGGLAILYSAVCSQLLAYLGWSHVVMRLGAGLAGITLHLMPAMGVLLSALFLREYPAGFHFVGIALILAGVTLSSGKLGRPPVLMGRRTP